MERTIFQTLKYRANNDVVLEHGPYKCEDSNAWLHSGFYFWEEFIEPAHYWGEKHNSNNYIITKATCFVRDLHILDLVGNLKQIREFGEVIKYLNELNILNHDSTVKHVIDYLQKSGVFDYIASRANTTGSFFSYELRSINFAANNQASLNLNPAVQICIYDLEAASFKDFEIVFEKVT